jgi:hypothetical protein
MSVDIEATAQSMPKSINSLKTTPPGMHRITFGLTTTTQWYRIMAEARATYGTNWRAQPRVKRKLERNGWVKSVVPVWFEVPDSAFGTWCAVKLAVEVVPCTNK